MTLMVAAAVRWTRRSLTRADGLMNRLYGWKRNPLYHSGPVVVALLGLVLLTGVYLLLFYRVGAPYESVMRITGQAWAGRWIRSLHRFASDAAVLAAAVHALRLLAQGRSWGPRTLAWVSGVVLLLVVLICGWTGYVMVWDVQGQVLAQAGARLLDVVPVFSEPISRAFVGEQPLPGAFFFLNLFLHIALPVGLGVILWIHVSRIARPALLPPKALTLGLVGLLLALSVFWPVLESPPADLFQAPGPAPYDLFYSFWLPAARTAPAWLVWLTGGVLVAGVVLAPLWTRPAAAAVPPPSVVDEQLCVGCEQCYLDCPYEAISMVSRSEGRSPTVARVDPALCVSCGICAGSCAPMGVGPPGRTGRDQLSGAREFIQRWSPTRTDVVVIGCSRGLGALVEATWEGAPVLRVSCGGNLHTSVVEFLIRAGAGGVLIAACPPRDCWNREGPKWLEERLYHDREAELQERVDRRRVRLIYASAGDAQVVSAALAGFRREVLALHTGAAAPEPGFEAERECQSVQEGAAAG